MLLTDSKWSTLAGGYRLPYDPRPAILKLAANLDVANAWEELWNNLHHQGDVAEAPMRPPGNVKLGALINDLDSSELDEILRHSLAWNEFYDEARG